MSNGELSFILEKLIAKNQIGSGFLAKEVGLNPTKLYNLVKGNDKTLTNGEVARTQEIAEKLVEVFSLTEPNRTFFIGLCHGRTLKMIARDTGLAIPLEYTKAKL